MGIKCVNHLADVELMGGLKESGRGNPTAVMFIFYDAKLSRDEVRGTKYHYGDKVRLQQVHQHERKDK
jgi:hypothetical protein